MVSPGMTAAATPSEASLLLCVLFFGDIEDLVGNAQVFDLN